MSSHWANKYIGKQYANGARGPDVFDCWGLVWWIQKHEFSRELPEFPAVEQMAQIKQQLSQWTKAVAPTDGDIVVMNEGHHVGVYISADAGLVLHAFGGSGVLKATVGAHPIQVLKKVYCCRGLEFYHFHG